MPNNKKYASLSSLQVFLDNLKNTFSTLSHKHTISDITDYTVDTVLSPTSNNPIANSTVNNEFDAVSDAMGALELAIDGKADASHFHNELDEKIDEVSNRVVDLSNSMDTNYDESIIGLSIDGTTITYIKGDGSIHTFETQDTNTTYSLGTDEVTGLTKLYATVGSAEDGTMTQKAIKTELDKKVGVAVDDSQNKLIFT